jgi:hypothetical protein
MAVTGSDTDALRLRSELAAANAALETAEVEARRLQALLRSSRSANERLRAEIRAMRRSVSWRLTYPLRLALRLVRRRKF